MNRSQVEVLDALNEELVRSIQKCHDFSRSTTSNVALGEILSDIKKSLDYVRCGGDPSY